MGPADDGRRRLRPAVVARGRPRSSPSPAPRADGRSAEGSSHLTVEVTIHHSTFDPPAFTFARGTTVTFVIRNTDPIEHEFIVGDQAVQYYIEHTEHPTHDGSVPGQISIPPGTTRRRRTRSPT